LSGNAIDRVLKSQGLGIRRQTLLDLVKTERQLIAHSNNMKHLPFNRKPNPAKLPTAITRQRREYSYVVRVRGTIPGTAALREQHITISSSELLTRGEAENLAAEIGAGEYDSGQMEVDSVQLQSIQKAGFAGTL